MLPEKKPIRASCRTTVHYEAVTLKPHRRVVADVAGGGRAHADFIKTVRKFGTWNVRSMYKGKLEIVVNEMQRYALDLVGISELRWKERGHMALQDDYKIYFSGNHTAKRNGVAIICRKKMVSSVLGYNPISDRIMTLGISAKPMMNSYKFMLRLATQTRRFWMTFMNNCRNATRNLTDVYTVLVSNRFDVLFELDEELGSSYEIWEKTKDAILCSAKKTLRKPNTKKINKMLSSATIELVVKRCELKSQDHSTNHRRINDLTRDIRRSTRQDKNNYLNEKCKEIETNRQCHNTRTMHKLIKEITTKPATRLSVIKDVNGNVLNESSQIKARSKEYCESLYEKDDWISNVPPISSTYIDEPEILLSEVFDLSGADAFTKAEPSTMIVSALGSVSGMLTSSLKISTSCDFWLEYRLPDSLKDAGVDWFSN
eukprot:gene9830-18402_t